MIGLRRASMGLAAVATLSRLLVACSSGGVDGPAPFVPPDFPEGVDAGAPFDPTQPGRLEGALGVTQTQSDAPPPLAGGTLLITHDDRFAIASDPDHDRVQVVDLEAHTFAGSLGLERGDEPGRAVEDAAGRVHVVMRRGGAVVTFDPSTRVIASRRAVCPSPRGIAYQPGDDVLHVACQGGELVTLPASGGEATRRLTLDDDLRDVVWDGATLYVSRFRAAEVLTLNARGTITRRTRPSGATPFGVARLDASVAWRMVAAPGGGVVLLHQFASSGEVTLRPGGYGQRACVGSIVSAGLSRLRRDATAMTSSPPLQGLALSVDVARSPVDDRLMVAVPGNALLAPRLQVGVVPMPTLTSDVDPPGCSAPVDGVFAGTAGQVVAVAFDRAGRLYAQTREPYTVSAVFENARVELGGLARPDTGHAIFHANAGANIACASCHPEGDDDGRVWTFSPIGPRRTQPLRGGILGTEPFHWDGDMHDFAHLTREVLGSRMRGGQLTASRADALSHWIDAQPALPSPVVAQTDAVTRGRALFEDPAVGCTSCHAGEKLTNNSTVDVGTGQAFQVPTLRGLAYRAPFMHDGCARTLRERFTNPTCGGGDQHGHTSQLSSDALNDLVAYLRTL